MKASPIQQAVDLQRYIRSLNRAYSATVGSAERNEINRLAKDVPELEQFANIFFERTDAKPGVWDKLMGRDVWGKPFDGYRQTFHSDAILLNLLDKSDPQPSKEITVDSIVASWTPESTFTERLTTLLLLPKKDRAAALSELFRTLENFSELQGGQFTNQLVTNWLLDAGKSAYQPLIAEDKREHLKNILLGAASNPKFPLDVLKNWMYQGKFTTLLENIYTAIAPKIAENFSNHISTAPQKTYVGVYGEGMVSTEQTPSTYLELRNLLSGSAAKAAFDRELLSRNIISEKDLPQTQ